MVRHGNMYKLPFGVCSFDTVTIDQVLSQADNLALVLAEAARILRPGGSLLIVDFATVAEKTGTTSANGISEQEIRRSLHQIGLRRTSVRHVSGGHQDVIVIHAKRTAHVGRAVA